MKRVGSVVVCLVVALLECSTSRAGYLAGSISSFPSDSDTLLVTSTSSGFYGRPGSGTGLLTLAGSQVGLSAGVQATLATSDTSSTAVYISNSLTNSTAVPWTSSAVLLSSLAPFTISSPTVAPAGWTVSSSPQTFESPYYVQQLTFQGAGMSVSPGGGLDFDYFAGFSGGTNYQLNESLTANINTVPEPGTLALLLAGLSAAGLLGWRTKR